jgi:hypothetical protein
MRRCSRSRFGWELPFPWGQRDSVKYSVASISQAGSTTSARRRECATGCRETAQTSSYRLRRLVRFIASWEQYGDRQGIALAITRQADQAVLARRQGQEFLVHQNRPTPKECFGAGFARVEALLDQV